MKVNIPETNLPRIVIIGGGFGGITLANDLRKDAVQVVMFDKNNYHTFQPLLYQVATGGLEPDSIAFPIRKMFKGQQNFHFRMAEVTGVEPKEKTLRTSIGEVKYDYLVIATGSKTNFFGNTSIEDFSVGMKNIPEALDLRSLILQNFEKALLTTNIDSRESLMNFVVVGAGPTGVETAGALAELKHHILPKDYPELDLRRMQIHLVEAGPKVLGGMTDESSENALKALKKLSVNVWLDTRVESYDGRVVVTNKNKVIPARTVIWSAGVMGNPVNGVESAIGRGNRIEVDHFNEVKGQKDIYAIGDVALQVTTDYPYGHPQVSPVAIQHAQTLARNLKSKLYDRPLKAFKYRDKGSMATIGRNKAVVEVNNSKFGGPMAWIVWMLVHLVYLAGFRNKLVVFINWFWSYVTYDKGNRLIIRPYQKRFAPMEIDVPRRETRVMMKDAISEEPV